MEEVLNKKIDTSTSGYATPFNVDLSNPEFISNFKEYFSRVSSLPESLKDILANPSTAEFIEENLGPTFNLTPEQKTEVTRIIRDVLLGDTSINQMASKISENLGTDPTVAYQIQSKIVNELFGSVIEDIKKMQKEFLPQKPPPTPVQSREQYPKPAQPRYTPPQQPQTPTRNQDSSVSPGNVVDLRNPK